MGYNQYSQSRLFDTYGQTASAVEKNLVTITLGFGANKIKVRMHKKVAAAMEAASGDYEIKVNVKKAKAYKLKPAYCGTYCWRKIKHADGSVGSSMSMHSWGIAIDLNAWSPNGQGRGAKSDIPKALVESMNKYGFYWGGDWSGSSYDPMHFEYAPASFKAVAKPGIKDEAAPKPSAPAKPAPKPPAKPTFKRYKVKTKTTLNVRAMPSTSSAVIKTLKKGTSLIVTGKATGTSVKGNKTWLKVSGGYIAEYYTERA
jgi:uncharacterized protein YgiM (DUF1202 family)